MKTFLTKIDSSKKNIIKGIITVMSIVVVLINVLSMISSNCQAKQIGKLPSGWNTNYDLAVQFLLENDVEMNYRLNKAAIAKWNYYTNLTEENKKAMLEEKEKEGKFRMETWQKSTSFAWKGFQKRNRTIHRWFKRLAVLGVPALQTDKYRKYSELVADMQDIYGKAKVCSKNNPPGKPCDLNLEPELTEIMKKSRDYNELKKVWYEWREVTGRKIKPKFLEYVKLNNEAARLNGFSDAGEMWRYKYESETFQEDVEELWQVIQPFYKQLHAFVRKKLILQYPDRGILPDGPIPAHLLGNMWGQNWENIFPIVKPYLNREDVDVTKRMIEQKMTPLEMYKMSDGFFISLGLKPMTPEFWNHSIIEKPFDREIICHASSADMSDGKDYRIKMCTRVNMEDFITVHHEMGHIQYYQQYSQQPAVFRSSANPGFHEAIGDTLGLSVSTSKHLREIGLMDARDEQAEFHNETMINKLMHIALDKIAFLPFGYLIDLWRWKVFSGEISENELNSKWWQYRLDYQGLCPPVERRNTDFDPGAKYHIISDIPYIRYFVSNIIQFQFHEALCDATGYKGFLYQCDIYKSKAAGKLISDVLKLGASVHWTEAMNIITKGKVQKMNAEPLIKYFDPLIKWLEKQNEGQPIGWKSHDPVQCP